MRESASSQGGVFFSPPFVGRPRKGSDHYGSRQPDSSPSVGQSAAAGWELESHPNRRVRTPKPQHRLTPACGKLPPGWGKPSHSPPVRSRRPPATPRPCGSGGSVRFFVSRRTLDMGSARPFERRLSDPKQTVGDDAIGDRDRCCRFAWIAGTGADGTRVVVHIETTASRGAAPTSCASGSAASSSPEAASSPTANLVLHR